MMKILQAQLMTVAGAAMCVLALMIAAFFIEHDLAGQLAVGGAAFLVGGLLGWRVSFHGLLLPLYAAGLMLALGNYGIFPFYSSDLSITGVMTLYTGLLAPPAIVAVLLVASILMIWKRHKRTNHASHATSEPAPGAASSTHEG
jgi:hypothetical protein